MITYTLASGDSLLISNEDKDLLQYSWVADKYRGLSYAARKTIRNEKIKKFRIHTLIVQRMIGRPLFKDEMVDHIDGNGLNNTRENLRVVTARENSWNKGKAATFKGQPTSSSYRGVCWHKHQKKWTAYISCDNKKYYLGYFDSEEDAARAWNIKAKELFGEYVRLNEV